MSKNNKHDSIENDGNAVREANSINHAYFHLHSSKGLGLGGVACHPGLETSEIRVESPTLNLNP